MLELKILTPQEKFLSSVEFNYNELKSQLQENLDKYQNLVFTEENMDEGKNTRARLNKLKTALDDKRKEIKKKQKKNIKRNKKNQLDKQQKSKRKLNLL